jgi:hypothetical protein
VLRATDYDHEVCGVNYDNVKKFWTLLFVDDCFKNFTMKGMHTAKEKRT